MEKDIEWFKKEIAPIFKGYELNYRYFKEGDFGSLNQVEFNSNKVGGNIDFWGLGWLGIFVVDYEKEREIFNILIEPHQTVEKTKALEKLQSLVKHD